MAVRLLDERRPSAEPVVGARVPSDVNPSVALHLLDTKLTSSYCQRSSPARYLYSS